MVKIITVKFKGNSVAAYNFEITRQYTNLIQIKNINVL